VATPEFGPAGPCHSRPSRHVASDTPNAAMDDLGPRVAFSRRHSFTISIWKPSSSGVDRGVPAATTASQRGGPAPLHGTGARRCCPQPGDPQVASLLGVVLKQALEAVDLLLATSQVRRPGAHAGAVGVAGRHRKLPEVTDTYNFL